MTNYYVLTSNDDFDLVRSPRDNTFSYRLQFQPDPVENPPELTWHWKQPDPPPDWLGTIDSVRLLSPAVRQVFDEHAGPADDLQWLPATVTTATHPALPYWVLHFPIWCDLLDEEHTTWGPSGLPMRWVLSRAKLNDHIVFIVPRLSSIVIVTDHVLDALRQVGVTGYTAVRVRII